MLELDISTLPAVIEFDGANPFNRGTRLIRLPKHRLLEHLDATDNISLITELTFVIDVCIQPAGTWKGLERQNQEEALVYAGIPSGDFAHTHGIDIKFPENRVQMVFFTADLEITKWRKCEIEPDSPGFPIDHENRFGAPLWLQD